MQHLAHGPHPAGCGGQANREGSRVTRKMLRNPLLLVLGAIVLAVLAFAWVDGGREPVRAIAEPVAVPGAAG